MKARIFYKEGQIVALEFDPVHYEDGAYPDGQYPAMFLVDERDSTQGYQDVPEHFVADWDPAWNDKPVAYVEIAGYDPPALAYNQGRCDADQLALAAAKQRKADEALALEWKRVQLAAVDWTTTPLTALERKIIIGVASLSDEELQTVVAEYEASLEA